MIWLLPLAIAGITVLVESCGDEGSSSPDDSVPDAGRKDVGDVLDAGGSSAPVQPPPSPPLTDYYVDAGPPSTLDAGFPPPPIENRPPIFSGIGNVVVNEGQILDVTLSAVDPDGDSLNYSAQQLPSGLNFNSQSGHLLWTPDFYQAGIYPLPFFASDGHSEISALVTITVNNVLTDKDGDGFIEEMEDCNDDDSTLRPLAHDAVNFITENTTICPGTYTDASISVEADGVTLTLSDVILQQQHGTHLHEVSNLPPAVSIQGHSFVRVLGLSVMNTLNPDDYGFSFPLTLLLKDGHDNEIEINQIEGVGYVTMENVHNSWLHSGTTDSEISVWGSDNNIFEGIDFRKYGIGLTNSSFNTIRNNSMTGRGYRTKITIRNLSHENVIQNNTITNATAENLAGGAILVGQGGGPCNGNLIEDNVLEYNATAISTWLGDRNVIQNNVIQFNAANIGAVIIGNWAAEGTRIFNNQITDNAAWGLRLMTGAQTTFIGYNDLQRNPQGNELHCDVNVCEGNQE